MNMKVISVIGIVTAVALAIVIGLAGSQHGVVIAGLPLFMLCGLAAFLVNWTMFVPAFVYQTEHYYDLVGSATYITLSVIVMALAPDPRTLLIGALVLIWAGRLGPFLFNRIKNAGEDRRFRSIKPNFLQFLMTWTLQGLWVFITYAAGLAAMTSAEPLSLDIYAAAGLAIWLAGFAIEVIADRQKSAFRADPENRNRFIQSGLWAWSRHPNYFGEIVLWSGIAVLAFPVLQGWQYATLISPIFVVVLLTKISGVRMLENRANKQWGNDPDYQAYRDSTSVLVPMPPG